MTAVVPALDVLVRDVCGQSKTLREAASKLDAALGSYPDRSGDSAHRLMQALLRAVLAEADGHGK